jgi:hypothetical protein
MIARGYEQASNVVQFPRELNRAPSCAQCRIKMTLLRGEPELAEPAAIG